MQQADVQVEADGRLKLMKQAMEDAMKELEDNQGNEEQQSEDLKYWKLGQKQGGHLKLSIEHSI